MVWPRPFENSSATGLSPEDSQNNDSPTMPEGGKSYKYTRRVYGLGVVSIRFGGQLVGC